MAKYQVCTCCNNEVPLIEETGMCGPCTFGSNSAIGEGVLILINKGITPKRGVSQVEVTLAEMDAVFRADKGWIRYDNQGYEHVYQYRVPYTHILVKVNSSINVHTGKSRPVGTDVIAMYSILYVEANQRGPKKVSGLCKSIVIERTTGWEERVKETYKKILAISMKKIQSSQMRH